MLCSRLAISAAVTWEAGGKSDMEADSFKGWSAEPAAATVPATAATVGQASTDINLVNRIAAGDKLAMQANANGALLLGDRRGLFLLLALQLLHRVHQCGQDRPGLRPWNEQRARGVVLVVWTQRHAVDADEAVSDRNVADPVDEDLRHERYP